MVDAVHVTVRGRQQVAALAVGVVDDGVEDRHPAQRAGLLLRARAARSTSSSTSIQSWHMPGPNGPSRKTVGGTMSQPVAAETSYAATSRSASVPSGKSQSGRSPAIGL